MKSCQFRMAQLFLEQISERQLEICHMFRSVVKRERDYSFTEPSFSEISLKRSALEAQSYVARNN